MASVVHRYTDGTDVADQTKYLYADLTHKVIIKRLINNKGTQKAGPPVASA